MGALEGRTALVTGAASGIGQAIARALARDGVQVLVHDVAESGQEVAAQIGGRFLQADLARPEAVRELARRAIEQAGRVDILVNNAGFQHVAPVEEFPEETWQRMLQVMLTAPFQLIKYLLPGMKGRRWGRIVNIASIHALVASPFKAGYISAKHGLLGLTRAAAVEAAPYGVTVNAICPAYVRTPLVEGQIAAQARSLGIPEQEVVERVMLEPAPIKRLIEPDEVASLASFLASEQAGGITGAAYTLDLGWTAR
ncbi:3-hydroxybutyrate dehydrogenase [Carboxydochorda subterranea]|uniref:3-hydroxybutyrate dehydrogenase n=1 Tax=Carboxydichorda subterranea TaxID=3109565 RepID=A0ABZ1BV60_9FIRM|nr:3-hydroxybutyrate dehydrogenase [Limnochorda sp. L945t]WRP16538.1 3-hydroxybutyrate dehydrogenase [Limnochorda sp. L945t]